MAAKIESTIEAKAEAEGTSFAVAALRSAEDNAKVQLTFSDGNGICGIFRVHPEHLPLIPGLVWTIAKDLDEARNKLLQAGCIS